MKFSLQQNIAGILGTLIIHVAIINVFLVIKLTTSSSVKDKELVVAFTEPEDDEETMLEEDVIEDDFYEWYAQQITSNIAVNVEDMQNDISTEKYIQEVQNHLDEGRDPIEIPDLMEESVTVVEEQKDPKNQNAFTGPTKVFWKLNGRQGNVPAPVYRCKGRGFVKINIEVDQSGNVIAAVVDETKSTGTSCHHREAVRYAKKSRFNASLNAPAPQKGWITYMFEAQ